MAMHVAFPCVVGILRCGGSIPGALVPPGRGHTLHIFRTVREDAAD